MNPINKIFNLFNSAGSKSKAPTESEKQAKKTLIQDINKRVNIDALSNDTWTRHRKSLIKSIKENDPRGFIKWPEVKTTMFWEADSSELEYLKNSKYWEQLKFALLEDSIGAPPAYNLMPESSGNIIHHAYSLVKFLELSNSNIEDLNYIFEFGGGYGSLCRLFYKMGYKGSYIIYDLPEFSCLQKYFLTQVNPELHITYSSENKENEKCVHLLTEPDQLIEFNKIDLFIALWSFSEVPKALRKTVLDKLNLTKTKNYFIAFQDEFSGVNNFEYFTESFLHAEKGRTIEEIKHLRGVTNTNHRYLHLKT